MPPPPELRDGLREIRVVEILQEVKAEHPPQADGHIRVARKVEVDLPRIGRRPQPGQRGGQELRPGGIDLVGQQAELVGQQHFLAQAEEKADRSICKRIQSLPSVPDLVRHGGIADNGARHQLGKQGDIERYPQRVAFRRSLSPINVQHIAQPLKGKKGDPDGQRHFRHRKPGPDAVQVCPQKAGIFEPAQQSQVDCRHQARPQPASPSVRSGQQAPRVVDRDGEQHQQQKSGAAIAVKKQAEQQQDQIPSLSQTGRQQKVDRQQQR